jgi:hypothetical protein
MWVSGYRIHNATKAIAIIPSLFAFVPSHLRPLKLFFIKNLNLKSGEEHFFVDRIFMHCPSAK